MPRRILDVPVRMAGCIPVQRYNVEILCMHGAYAQDATNLKE